MQFSGRFWRLVVADGLQSLSVGLFTITVALAGAASDDITGLGLVLAARTLPTLFVGLLGGVLADRWRRTVVAGVCAGGVAATHLVLALALPLWGLGALSQLVSLVAGLLAALGAPSRYAILPSLVKKDQILRANAIVRTSRNVASVGAPMFGGILFAAIGLAISFWIVAGLALVSALLILSIRSAEHVRKPEPLFREIIQIPSFVRLYPWLLPGILFWAFFLAVYAGANGVLLPMYVQAESGATAWATYATCTSIGYVLGAVIALRMKVRRGYVAASLIVVSLCIPQFFLTPFTSAHWVWFAGGTLGGIAMELSGVFWGSALQSLIEDEHLGRVSSLDYAASFGLVPIGYAVAGIAGARLPIGTLLAGSGVIMVMLVFTVSLVLAVLRRCRGGLYQRG